MANSMSNDVQIRKDQSSNDLLINSNTQSTATIQYIDIDTNKIENIDEESNKKKYIRRVVIGLAVILAVGCIATIITVPSVLLTNKSSANSSTTNGTVTTTITQATTTVTCATGYTQTSSGTCVNLLISFNNCGSIGYVCTSNYTSCTNGRCSTRPSVQLPGAISVPGWANITVDDAMVRVILPVSITLYNYTTNNITVTSNGVLCLGTCSIVGSNGNLPTTLYGGPTVFGLWDDLMIYSGTAQTIYYAISGSAPNRITTFEFYESHFSSSQQYYHFQIIFYENLPNIVKCLYFEISTGGSSATIGLQRSSTGPNITYSVNQANAVSYNTTILFDTNAGTSTG